MPANLVYAEAAGRLAVAMLREQHARLADLDVRFAWSDAKPPTKQTCKAFAQAGICSPRERLLSRADGQHEGGADVLVVLNQQLWDGLMPHQQRAVVDHALEHVWVDEDEGTLSLREHDLADFGAVLERNGLYLDTMKYAASVILKLGQAVAAKGVAERVVETADRLVHGDREGVSEETIEAWDRLAAMGATVQAGSEVPA